MGFNTTMVPGGAEVAVQPASVVPSATWQMLSSQVRTEPLPQDMDAMWDAAKGYVWRFKYRTQRYLAKAQRVVDFAYLYKDVSDARLREMALDYRAMFRTGKETPEDLLKAVALVREVASRTRQEEHYLVQVAGARHA